MKDTLATSKLAAGLLFGVAVLALIRRCGSGGPGSALELDAESQAILDKYESSNAGLHAGLMFVIRKIEASGLFVGYSVSILPDGTNDAYLELHPPKSMAYLKNVSPDNEFATFNVETGEYLAKPIAAWVSGPGPRTRITYWALDHEKLTSEQQAVHDLIYDFVAPDDLGASTIEQALRKLRTIARILGIP